MTTNVDTELKLVCKLDRFKREYELSIEDIEDGIKELRSIVEKYEELHTALKNRLEVIVMP